nr:hypothetical protein [Tanacetum cinerariifolium]
MVFYQMEIKEVSDRFMAPCFVNGLEAYDGEINLGVEENMISNEYAVKLCLEHEVKRGNKVVKNELIVALKDKIYFVKFIINLEEDDVEPGVIFEEEEAVKRIRDEALKEKDDPGAFIFPIRLEGQVNENALANTGSDINTMPYQIYEQLGREDMKKVDRGITMINHTQAEGMRILINVLYQVGVTTLIAKFIILDILIDRDLPIVVCWGFLRTIGGIVNTHERLFSTFDGFCHQTFRAARSDLMRNAENDSDDEEDYQIKRNKSGAPIYGPKPTPYLNCNNPAEDAKSRYNTRLAQLLSRNIYSPCDVNWDVLNKIDCDGEINDMLRIRLREAGSDEEIFTSVTWIKAFNINEPIYAELCHEYYSTYKFDEVCADDELQTKKIIKFRLGGRAHSLTLLEFARRLGLYQAVELKKEGFNVYFEGGLCSDEHFNAQDYWLSISREENLSLSRSHTSTYKETNFEGDLKDDYLWFVSEDDWDVVRSLSASIYCRDMDTTTLRDLIDYDGKLIPEDPQLGVL